MSTRLGEAWGERRGVESPWEVPKRRGGTRRGPLLKKRVLDAQKMNKERGALF